MESISKSLLGALVAGILAAVLCQQVQSAPITGSIDFGGTVTFGDSTGANTTSLSSATRVNVWNSSFVLQDSGDFSSISPGTNVTMGAPWIFNPSTATPSLWSVGGFKFDLSTSVVVSQSSTFLNITGTGMVSSTNSNLDPTPGTWSFTSSDSSGQPQTTFGFQAQSTAVPEASSIYLFALGIFVLAGANFVRRKFSLARQSVR